MIDPNVPPALLNTQKWFATLISQPLQDDHKIPQHTPFNTSIETEAAEHITPSNLKPYQRLELYHQQYWWRLLQVLQKNFPILARHLGYTHFNQQIGIPYLTDHPPTHWALCRLGDTLPDWLSDPIHAQMAAIDWAAQQAFWIKSPPSVDFSTLDQAKMLTTPLTLSPHITLFKFDRDLFTFREALLKHNIEHWKKHPQPMISEKTCYNIAYRSPENQVAWKELSEAAYHFLLFFQQGATIQEVCDSLPETYNEEAQTQLPFWFKDWILFGWFTAT